jgi:hypothetical protein
MRLTTGALSLLAVLVAALCVSNVLLWREVSRGAEPRTTGATPADESAQVARNVALPPSDDAPELAPYMGQLQRLMHKLGLSIDAEHTELARFYLYETKELTETICEEVPEYRGHPIALLIGRTLGPELDGLAQALEGKAPEALGKAYEAAIAACNDCHRATQHAFIRVPTRASGVPYLQTFERAEAP